MGNTNEKTFEEQYEIVEVIGSGTFAIVYKGENM